MVIVDGPLSGLVILDVTTGTAGPYATKLLADHGADVIKVEPPGGDPSRAAGPFTRGEPNPEASGRFLFLNTSKRSIVLDLADAADRAMFEGLVRQVDAVIDDHVPAASARLGLGYERLKELNDTVVLTSITPWGLTGPYAAEDFRVTDIVVQAMGGPMLWTGSAEREPIRLGAGGELALYHAGGAAALATMMALFRREQDGQGDQVDISIYETAMASRDRSAPFVTGHIYTGMEPKRRTNRAITVGAGTKPCSDGWVSVSAVAGRLPTFLRMIGLDDLAADPSLSEKTNDPELADLVEANYMVWLSDKTKGEVAELAQQHRLLSAPLNRISDLPSDPHFRTRGVWETIDHPATGPVEYPGRPFVLHGSPRPHARRAPLLDEHRDELIELAGRTATRTPVRYASSRPVQGASGRRRLPLEGVRVVDLTAVWAGPYVTQLLAEWGAEVIRVEPTTRVQPNNTRYAERIMTHRQQVEKAEAGTGIGGFYANLEPADDPWNRNSGFNCAARNKLSMSCDISTEEGREHFLRLVEGADIVVENNTTETIDNANVGYEVLKERRPDIIMLRMPAYGLTGPYSTWRAFGAHVEGVIGHQYARGYPDAAPDEGGEATTADGTAGVHGGFALLAALRHRELTGEGQLIELPLAESFIPMLGELILDWNMNQSDPGQWGNRHRSHAPHGAFPTTGPDQWIALDIANDQEFAALARVLGESGLASDPRFCTAAQRKANEQELNAAISERTRSHDKWDLFRALQAAGVVAGPLQTAAERVACPHLAARGFWVELDQESCGPFEYPGLTWRMRETPNALWRGPCMLGEDNEYVYRDLLGLTEAEFEDLKRRELIGDRYTDRALGRA